MLRIESSSAGSEPWSALPCAIVLLAGGPPRLPAASARDAALRQVPLLYCSAQILLLVSHSSTRQEVHINQLHAPYTLQLHWTT